MLHSQIVEYVAAQAHERGRQKNIQQGRQQGIQQGAQEITCELILETLALRLQIEAVPTLRPTVEEIDDLKRLKQLFHITMRVETLDEVTIIFWVIRGDTRVWEK